MVLRRKPTRHLRTTARLPKSHAPSACTAKGKIAGVHGVLEEKKQTVRHLRLVAMAAALLVGAGAVQSSDARPPTAAAASGAARAQSPAAVIRSLYRLHNKGYGPVFDRKGRKHVARYFDRPLADLLWKNILGPPSGEVGNLDFDPLFFTQDLQLTDLRIGAPKIERNKAHSVVTFKNYGRKTAITFLLRRTNAGWKISDLDYGNGERLVKILSRPF